MFRRALILLLVGNYKQSRWRMSSSTIESLTSVDLKISIFVYTTKTETISKDSHHRIPHFCWGSTAAVYSKLSACQNNDRLHSSITTLWLMPCAQCVGSLSSVIVTGESPSNKKMYKARDCSTIYRMFGLLTVCKYITGKFNQLTRTCQL